MLRLIVWVVKVLLVGLWVVALLGALSMWLLPVPFQHYVLPLAGMVLFVHFIEYLAMKAKVMSVAKVKMSLIQTMLWGFGYWLPLLKNK